jgi:hypothetical protein
MQRRLVLVAAWLGALTWLWPQVRAAEPEAEGEERAHRIREQVAQQVNRIEARINEVREQVMDKVREVIDRELDKRGQSERKPEPLGRTVRIQFSSQPDKALDASLICATRQYSVVADDFREERHQHFEANGVLLPIEADGKPEGLLLTYTIMAMAEGRGPRLHYELRGSTMVRFNQEIEIARSGENVLLVTVTALE